MKVENKIKAWAIYPTPKANQSTAFDWLMDSAVKNNIELEIKFSELFSQELSAGKITILYDNKEVALPRVAVMRNYDFELSSALELLGVKVINTTHSMELCRDKLLTHQMLITMLIPTPTTLYNVNNFTNNVNKLNLPFILKARKGSKGEEVMLISCEQDFLKAKGLFTDYITQRYISTSYGKDIRVWVIEGKVVASTLRCNDNSFKSNIALGGTAKPYKINEEIANLAVNSCKALGLELAGVDILFDGSGYSVCEVNGNAGFRSFSIFEEQVDIPYLIFKYIAQKLQIL